MKLENLEKLFVHELRDLRSAETQNAEALPKMIGKVRDDELKQALEQHLEETKNQINRLDDIFSELGTEANDQFCEGMEGLIEESEEILSEDADEEVRDAGIISSAQRIEHYEMAGYGTARTYARMLDRSRIAELLESTLNEEKEADRKLTNIAERTVNPKAMKRAD